VCRNSKAPQTKFCVVLTSQLNCSCAKQHVTHSPVACTGCHWRPVSPTASQHQHLAGSPLAQPSQQAVHITTNNSTEDLSTSRITSNTRAPLLLRLADCTPGTHSQPAPITARLRCFEHFVACAQNVNVVTHLFTKLPT